MRLGLVCHNRSGFSCWYFFFFTWVVFILINLQPNLNLGLPGPTAQSHATLIYVGATSTNIGGPKYATVDCKCPVTKGAGEKSGTGEAPFHRTQSLHTGHFTLTLKLVFWSWRDGAERKPHFRATNYGEGDECPLPSEVQVVACFPRGYLGIHSGPVEAVESFQFGFQDNFPLWECRALFIIWETNCFCLMKERSVKKGICDAPFSFLFTVKCNAKIRWDPDTGFT